MRRPILSLFLILASSASLAQNDSKKDAAWFQQFSDIAQVAYIAGFIEGAHIGTTAGTLAACPPTPGAMDCLSRVSGAAHENYLKYLTGVTAGQIHRGVKSFYGDYRNSNLEIGYAIIHVGKAIAGVPAADLEKQLEFVRQNASR